MLARTRLFPPGCRARGPSSPPPAWHLCVVRSHTMQLPSEDALTASSPPLFLTAMELTGPLWSFREASIVATPLATRHTRTMPA
jgi:hypothetical protein